MPEAQPGQEQRMDAIELLARLEEASGNIAAAFTLRTVGVVGIIFEEKLQVVEAALTRPTADLGEDGELVERLYRHAYKLPDGYCNDEDFGCNAESPESLIMAELDSGPRGTEVMQVLTAYGYSIVETEALNQARDRLILYREALERIAEGDWHRTCEPPHNVDGTNRKVSGEWARIARAVLSRSGG